MKSDLTKLSLALLSAVFILGCQDLGTGAVEADGLEPQFAKGGKGKPPGGNVSATVTLAGGMEMAPGLPLVGKYDDNTVSLNTNDFDVKIDMKFSPDQTCTMIVGADDGGVMDHLEGQLATASPTSGAFFLEIDKTGLQVGESTQAEKHLLLVEYAHVFDGHSVQVLIIHGDAFAPAEVAWVTSTASEDVFNFTGQIVVWMHGVGGLKGKRGRRATACDAVDKNLVTVTVDRS